MRARGLIAASAVAAMITLGGASPAQAWTLTAAGSALIVNDEVGVPDGPSVDDASSGQLRISNPSSPFTGPLPGGCTLSEEGDVVCGAAGVSAISATLSTGSDSASVSLTLPVTFDGGDGDDVLTGGGANDSLAGGPGNDVLDGDRVTIASTARRAGTR